ncbi:MAG: hypothetical protein JOZ72_10875 [Alphaproteobacteria bacterium]|nr:hypothetical protein [Alphaproteobacteria bacterium]
MRTLVVTLCLCLCTAAAAAAAEEEGTLVMAIGTTGAQITSAQLLYKRSGASIPILLPYLGYSTEGLFGDRPEFSDGESGVVRIKKFPPGTYEFYFLNFGNHLHTWSADRHFSLPFTIEAGKTTYLGDFAAVPLVADDEAVGAYFLVTDKHERDIAIARRKDPALPPVTVAIPDVDSVHAVFFRSKE